MRQKRKRVVESFRDAADAIGPVERDMAVFAVTRGQWSMLDAILHLLKQLGRAHISVWTWTIADYEVEAFEGLLCRQEIERGSVLVIDQSADRRNHVLIDRWRDRFGEDTVRVCRNHAKIARIWNDEYRLLARGSMNLNFNPRFEQFDLTEGGPEFGLVERLEGELPPLGRKYSNHDLESAGRLNLAFEMGELEMFRGIKQWAK